MKRITDLRKRVADFNEALTSGRIIQNIIWDNEAYIVDLNAEEQLFEQGINRLGVEISDYAPYSPVTIAIKEAKGQPTNRVTLRDEGDFESSFYLEVGDKQFEIKASDFKAEDLIKRAIKFKMNNKKIYVYDFDKKGHNTATNEKGGEE